MPGRRIRSEREWQAALADHEQGLKVLERVGDAAGRCELLSSLGWIRLMRGEHREAGDAYRRILRAPRPKECRHSVLRARTGLGHLAWLRGRPADASRHYRAALGKLGPKDAGLRIAGLNHLSNLAASSSELASAQTRLQGALLFCCAGRHRRERAYTLLHLGRIRSLLGETDEAARILRSALDEFNGIGDLHGVVFALLAQSVHALSANDAAGAGRLAKAASEEASSPDLTGMREYADAIAARSAAAETRGSVPR